jgi:hypothetical protein
VLLALLADEEGLHVGARGERRAGHRVGPHGEAADGRRAQLRGLGRHELAERTESGREQDRPLGVHVVLGGSAARERHLADHERVLAELRDEPFACITHACTGGGR